MPDFSVIPAIEQLRQRPGIAALEREHGHAAVVAALRLAAAAARGRIASGAAGGSAETVVRDIETTAAAALRGEMRGSLIPVINATGVIVHTNLGRAPLADTALQRLIEVGRGYSNLEYDLAAGRRGSRSVHAERLLTALTGAEAALVVNNNAAATLLTLAGLAAGREVVISRGELVEIGGGFRVPDVMAQSGAVLREVGTTNRTRLADYRAVIGPRTALLLRVHRSNFRIEGFTEQPTLADLAALADETGIPLVDDLGSGCLIDTPSGEPTVQQSVAAGVHLVCFSADKMLGGPQAGIIVGRRAEVAELQRHPLMRALRVDKLTLAALEGTLLEYRAGRHAASVPVVRMLALSAEQIASRAAALVEALAHTAWRLSLVDGASTIGGGSAPGTELPTRLIAVAHDTWSPDQIEARLRAADPPIVARIERDRVLLDLRTVLPDQDAPLAGILRALAA